jgi:hypothetical protein
MRVASRIAGILLALAGLGFLVAGFGRQSVLEESTSGRTAWIAGSFSAVIGIGFILGVARHQMGDHLDWRSVPDWIRSVLKPMLKAGKAAFLILVPLFIWDQWSHHEVFSPIVLV